MRGTLALNAFVSLALAARQKYDVATTNGKITGHPAPGMNNTIEFLGVPYAQPPVGQLRFAEPLPPKEKTSYIASDWV
jgi:cholinesterase